MAREIHEREDLLRDAKALTSRIELQVETNGRTETVFAGFRPNEALSLYFETEPVYQFNSRRQLRRAFVDDRLIKAEAGRLIAMKRNQNPTLSELERHDLTDAEQNSLVHAMKRRLAELKHALDHQQFQLVGQVPAEGDLICQLKKWLENLDELTIADSPRVS